MLNVYQNSSGSYYLAASPNSPGDSLIPFPSAALVAYLTAQNALSSNSGVGYQTVQDYTLNNADSTDDTSGQGY